MRYLIPTTLGSFAVMLASNAFADSCNDAICSLAGHAGSSLGGTGIATLLGAGAVILGVWLYRRRDRINDGAMPERSRN